jgi:LPXTG-motif cell wall-anchored protein
LTGDATVGIQLGVRVDTASQSTSISPAWLLGAGGLMIAAMAGVWFWQRRK